MKINDCMRSIINDIVLSPSEKFDLFKKEIRLKDSASDVVVLLEILGDTELEFVHLGDEHTNKRGLDFEAAYVLVKLRNYPVKGDYISFLPDSDYNEGDPEKFSWNVIAVKDQKHWETISEKVVEVVRTYHDSDGILSCICKLAP